ncbi:MAG: sigma 54-interacting transcriptional regulator [Planctomycetaceae bacterium]|jgi:Nif-specific regulatory protein|nr:sigma 54-interacting transcriptional regulator [Planctomycetaceae bacterium]
MEGTGELQLLYEVSMLLNESGKPHKVFQALLQKMSAGIGIKRGVISVLNRITGTIGIAEAVGLDYRLWKKGCYLPGEGITGRVVETGNPCVIPRIAEEPQFLNRTGARTPKEAQNTSFVCVPIRAGNEVIGTISIDLPYHKETLDRNVQLLTIIAVFVSQFVRACQITIEELEELKEQNKQLKNALQQQRQYGTSIGKSEGMRRIREQMLMVCRTNAAVLLLGETGVGKERFANDIHYASHRADKPFVKVNCAAIPENLIESLLFGHEKGAFTGAVQQQKGYFEQADGGTIFLDEIGELPLLLQAKFLRVLQERTFERIGGSETLHVDVRVIAATNVDLKKSVSAGTFRQDLYYRISVFPILIPPLRERKPDIMLLADVFAKRYAKEYGKPEPVFSLNVTNMLSNYPFPGNIRELENAVERAVIMTHDGKIHSFHLPEEIRQSPSNTVIKQNGTLPEILDTVEREMLTEALRQAEGNRAKAARLLGITERTIGLRIKKYQISGEGNLQ